MSYNKSPIESFSFFHAPPSCLELKLFLVAYAQNHHKKWMDIMAYTANSKLDSFAGIKMTRMG